MKTELMPAQIVKRGHLGINLPVVLLVTSIVSLGSYMQWPWIAYVLGGSLVGLFTWSKLIENWRDWAVNNGVSPKELLEIAQKGRVDMFAREPFQKIVLKDKK